MDSQSVKSTGVGGEDGGYDGGKKVKGLKSVTCSWTAKASYSKAGYIGQRSCTGTGSRRYCRAGGYAVSPPQTSMGRCAGSTGEKIGARTGH